MGDIYMRTFVAFYNEKFVNSSLRNAKYSRLLDKTHTSPNV